MVSQLLYIISIYIIHRWDSNIKVKLLLILLYNINTVLSLLLCCQNDNDVGYDNPLVACPIGAPPFSEG